MRSPLIAAAAAAAVLALGATGARAVSPPPELVSFDGATNVDVALRAAGVARTPCHGQAVVSTSSGSPAGPFADVTCPEITLRFDGAQAFVRMWVGSDERGAVTVTAYDAEGGRVDATTFAPEQPWTHVALAPRDPPERPVIARVTISVAQARSIHFDELSLSTEPQPDTEITSGPDPLTRARDARFAFASSDPDRDAVTVCSLDGARERACRSPVGYLDLADGPHTFRVWTVAAGGLVEATPAEYRWTVDTQRPDTRIDAGPPRLTQSPDARFEFGSPSQGVASYRCRLDDGRVLPSCVSPVTHTGLAEGDHVFSVWAVDGAGNADDSPAQWTWTIDRTPASVVVTAPAPLTNTAGASIAFTSPAQDVERFECRFDGDPGFAPCASPAVRTRLPDGAHWFQARAIDRARNVGPASPAATWTVDTVAPETTISGAPPRVTAGGAEVTFGSPDAAGFECGLDGAAFAPCTSPLRVGRLADGEHHVEVRAVDGAGNRDATPAAAAWTVDAPDADGVPAASDNCPDAANPAQQDDDGDRIGDACDPFRLGNQPPVAGVRATLRVLSGEVRILLPGRRTMQAGDGYIPLKGVASIPIGSTVDARRGRVELATAGDFRPATRRLQTATLGAAMFRIRQARAQRRGVGARTDLELQTPPGSERACVARGAAKGAVRSLSGASKGVFRAVAGASVTTFSGSATWVVEDRCDGTLTQVGRGRATVYDRARHRTRVVRAGEGYLARARLFVAKKGRSGQVGSRPWTSFSRRPRSSRSCACSGRGSCPRSSSCRATSTGSTPMTAR